MNRMLPREKLEHPPIGRNSQGEVMGSVRGRKKVQGEEGKEDKVQMRRTIKGGTRERLRPPCGAGRKRFEMSKKSL